MTIGVYRLDFRAQRKDWSLSHPISTASCSGWAADLHTFTNYYSNDGELLPVGVEDTITAGDECETAPGVPSPVIYWSPVWWMTNGLVTRLVKMKGWSMKVRELFHLWAHNGRCSWRKNIVSHSLKHPKPYTVHSAVRWPRKGPWCRAQHPGRCPRCSGFGGLGLKFTSRA